MVASPIEVEDLDTVAPFVAEDKERPALWIDFERALGQGVEPIERFTHVAGFHREVDLEAAGEGKHVQARVPSARMTAPTSSA